MKTATSSAISSNEKIFPILADRLASKDPKDFVHTTRKLAAWLSSEKAYYAAARPKIVELLEVAISALDTFIHHPAIVELAEHLRLLVQAVLPFQHRFVGESELYSRLERVIRNPRVSLFRTDASAMHANARTQGPVAANIPAFHTSSPAHLQPTLLPVWRVQTSLPMPDAAKVVSDGTVDVDPPQACSVNPSEVPSSSRIEAIPSLAFSVTDTPQNPGESVPPTVPSKPQPKRVRRAELPEDLIARDLDWYKSTHGSAIVNGSSDPGASSSKASESLTVQASDAPPVPKQSPSPKKKTARMVPSRLVRRMTQGEESGASISTSPPTSALLAERGGSCEDAPIPMDVDEQHPSMEMIESDARSVSPEARDVPTVSQPEDLLSLEPQPVFSLSNEPSIRQQIPQTEYHSPSVEHPLNNSEIRTFTPPPVREVTLDRTESMDISPSNDELGPEKLPLEPPSNPEPTPLESPQMLLQIPILPPRVNVLEPPLNLNFKILPPGQPQQSEMATNRRRFDGEMTIIHSIQGKPFTHTHTIDISLNESIFSKISKWVNRRSHPSQASQGVCISLACYRLVELFDTIKSESVKRDIEVLTLQSPCSWPSSNQLCLHIKTEERHTIIALSPPFFLTSDQCVDISSLMKPGNNTLEMIQTDDLSEYLIVLHAHRPTRVQLTELDVVRDADERWKRLLDVVSARAGSGKMADIVGAS